jgi:hypothetical protein
MNAYGLLVEKPEGKRPLGKPRRRWVDNMRMDLGEVGWGVMDWIGLAQNRNRNYRVASLLVASRIMLSCIELVS